MECDFEEMDKTSNKEKRADMSSILWVCLDCYQIFCDGHSDSAGTDSHIKCHAEYSDHPLAIPITPWCFPCNSLQEITAELEENKEVKSAKDVKEEMMEMEKEEFNGLPSGNLTGYRVKRMVNFRNKCFYNSVLQNLLSMDRLRDEIFKLAPSDARPITSHLLSLFKASVTDAPILDTSCQQRLFDYVCSEREEFKRNQEEDSHEFLSLFINRLLQEGTSCVNDILGGLLFSTVCYAQCGHTSTRTDRFLDLSLSIPAREEARGSFADEVDDVKIYNPPSDAMIPAREEDGGSSVAIVFDADFCSSPSDANMEGLSWHSEPDTPDSLSSPLFNASIESWIEECHVLSSDKVDGNADEQDLKDDGDDYHNYTNNKEEKEPDEDPEDCCGQHPCICNKDSSGVPKLPESGQLLSEKEGLTEDQDIPMLENFSVEKSCENESNLDFDDKPAVISDSEVSNRAGVKVHVNAKRRRTSISRTAIKFGSGIQRSIDDVDRLLLEGCLDLCTKSEAAECNFRAGIQRSNNDGGPLSIKRCLDFTMSQPVEHNFRAGIQRSNDDGGPLSIESCLDWFTRSEHIECNDACPNCKESGKGKSKSEISVFEVADSKDEGMNTGSGKLEVGATKRDLILKAPLILMIHLKRFKQDEYGMHKKINCHINFQEQLDLTPFIHRRYCS